MQYLGALGRTEDEIDTAIANKEVEIASKEAMVSSAIKSRQRATWQLNPIAIAFWGGIVTKRQTELNALRLDLINLRAEQPDAPIIPTTPAGARTVTPWQPGAVNPPSYTIPLTAGAGPGGPGTGPARGLIAWIKENPMIAAGAGLAALFLLRRG